MTMTNAEAEAVVANINKKLGVGTVVRASDVKSTQRVTSGSLTLDIALGGGWPVNQWNEIIGEYSVGKTLIALQTIAANQRRDPNYTAVWIAAEEWVEDFAKMNGVDTSRVYVVGTNIMEEAYDAAIQFAESKAIDCIVIDSLPALVPGSEDEKNSGEMTVGRGALITNQFWRKIRSAMQRSMIEDERPVLGLLLNQWRMKIGVMHGDPRIHPGGKGTEFSMFTIVDARRSDWIEAGTGISKRRVGINVKCRTVKNKTAPPQQVAAFDYYFADGGPCSAGDIDFAKEAATMAVVEEIITKRGAWYFYGDQKWQGMEGLMSAIREDADLRAQIEGEVLTALGVAA